MNPFGRIKPKGKVPEEASVLIRAIFSLDALRVGMFPPGLRTLRKDLTESHILAGEGISWSALRRDINDLINFPEKSEKIAKRASTLPILTILVMLGFAATAISAIVDLYILPATHRYPLSWAVIPGLVFMCAVSTLRWHYEESIRTFYEKEKPKVDRIRRVNNQLITRLILVLQKAKYPLKECYFALYNSDYDNIQIKSRPKFYRGYYQVYPGQAK